MIARDPNAGPLEPINTELPRQAATNADYKELGSFSEAKQELTMLFQDLVELSINSSDISKKEAKTKKEEIEKQMRALTEAVYKNYTEHTQTYAEHWQQLARSMDVVTNIDHNLSGTRRRITSVVQEIGKLGTTARHYAPEAARTLTEIMTSASISAVSGLGHGTARGVRNIFKRT